MHILWIIIIGFIAGVIAKFFHPGSSNEPSGFILTTLLGIAGSFVATYLGKPSDGIKPVRARASSAPWWARSSCLLFGASSLQG